MIPTPNKRLILPSLLCALALWNCGSDKESDFQTAAESANANVSLSLRYSTPPLLDSLVLDCYGADTLHLVHSTDNQDFNLNLYPSDHWVFDAKIYANGALMQKGEMTTKLEAGTTVNLSIQMHPVVGFFYVEVPTGLKNDAGIANGTMVLKSTDTTHTIPMETEAGRAVFKSGMLTLGVQYDVEIILFDSEGNEMYKLTDQFELTEDSPVPDLTLNSLRSQVALSIKAAEPRNVSVTLPLNAGFRTPEQEDLLITEYFSAAEKSDSSQYEFVEIYNGSLDTLLLDDCSLGLYNNNAIRFVPLTTSEIAPRQVLVLGDALSEKTPPLHVNTDGWYDMVNGRGSVVLQCNGVTLDSLYYSNAPDSLTPNVVPGIAANKYGLSGQLNIEQWENRKDSTAWCLGTPTPGTVTFCDQ